MGPEGSGFHRNNYHMTTFLAILTKNPSFFKTIASCFGYHDLFFENNELEVREPRTDYSQARFFSLRP